LEWKSPLGRDRAVLEKIDGYPPYLYASERKSSFIAYYIQCLQQIIESGRGLGADSTRRIHHTERGHDEGKHGRRSSVERNTGVVPIQRVAESRPKQFLG
jgi:hypothetical protein